MEGEIASTETATPVVTTDNQATETTQESNQTQAVTQPEVVSEKPAGFDPIDVKTATPEQIEARINRLYGNMKNYEATARKVPDLEQANQILAEQLRVLNETQNKVINHLQISDFQDAEQQLKTQREAAWAAGNSKTYDEINDKLRDLSVKRALSEMQAQQKPQQVIQQQPRGVNGEDIITRAVQQGAVTSDEANIYRSWMNEQDDIGSLKRPWVNQGDPRNAAALAEGRAVFNNPAYSSLSFGQKLQEIDRRMGVKMQTQGQNVLGSGNLTRPTKNNNVKVTDYEAKIAVKTKFGGSKAKSDADHVEAWRQAKIKSQQKGASR